jgi:3-deoxy-D-manno-octulosonate 8-phosphate phosphatase (KDO 8-P phosphatase)
MKNEFSFNFSKIDVIIFDFDGVFTSNRVFVDENGKESVECSRSDGLACDVLNKLNVNSYIISTEKNSVVNARAKKINIPVFQGVSDKLEALENITKKHETDLSRVLFVGNDVNDYYAMKASGFSACPSDSHSEIKSFADIVLKSKGGQGVIRELLEDVFELNFIEILYDRR